MATAVGVDVSNHQGSIDYAALAPHVGFVIAKASQGIGYADPWYVRNRSECKRLGIPFGAYHWLEPAEAYGVPDEVVEQIRWFKSRIDKADPPDLCCTIDVEETRPGGGRRIGIPSPNDIATAVDTHEAVCGHTPLVYGGQPVLQPAARVRPEVTRCRFWKAIYPGANNGDPKWKAAGYGTTDPWPDLVMWQWTSTATVPGINTWVDMNDLFVPLTDLMVGGEPEEGEMTLAIPPWGTETSPGRWESYELVDGTTLVAWGGAEIRDVANPDVPHPAAAKGTDGWVLNLEAAGFGPGPYSGVAFSPDGFYVIVKHKGAGDAGHFAIPTGRRYEPPAPPAVTIDEDALVKRAVGESISGTLLAIKARL